MSNRNLLVSGFAVGLAIAGLAGAPAHAAGPDADVSRLQRTVVEPRDSHGKSTVVGVPAGSVDALAAAIAAAGPRGVVIVEAGDHVENGTVVVDIPVSIIGEPGAVVRSDTPLLVEDPFLVIEPALHVKDTHGVVIQGLELTPLVAGSSNAAILIDNSPRVTVESNVIAGYTAGILIQEGDRADISGNAITLTGMSYGIVVINGEFARVTDNVVANAVFGIWACDKKGHASRNTTTDSFIGLILCKVPPAVVISGETVGSEFSATDWHVQNNSASRNVWGYGVTDGSTGNVLANNAAADNQIDIEVLGDSMFFGFFTPSAGDTVIAVGSHHGLTIHDCGVDTTTNGNAELVDIPCF